MPHDHSCTDGCGCGPVSAPGPRPDVAQSPTPWRPKQTLRALSIAIIRRGESVLAGPVFDDAGQIIGWRPLGGEIEFGEAAHAALIRELHEETGQEICDVHQIGVLENLFTHHGQTGHEIVLVFAARFANAALYEADHIAFAEQDGIQMEAKWVSLAKAAAGRVALFPDGLADLLLANQPAR